MAATARGDGPSGFSFEPSLIILSGSRQYLSAISSMDLPGTYSFMSFIEGRISFSNLIQHRHHSIDLFFRDRKRWDKTKYGFRGTIKENPAVACFCHDIFAFYRKFHANHQSFAPDL